MSRCVQLACGVRARALLRPARDYSPQWAGGGAKLRTPSELTKNTNCDCPLIKPYTVTLRQLQFWERPFLARVPLREIQHDKECEFFKSFRLKLRH